MNLSNGDWAGILSGVAALLVVIGGAIAWTRGVFRQRGSDQQERQRERNHVVQERQRERDDRATKDADRTLDSVFKLLDELQEELRVKSAEIVALKEEVTSLRNRVYQLEAERNQP